MSHIPLITAAQAQSLLPALSAVESQALAAFCAPASLAVERWCKHHMGYGQYVEYHRPEQSRKIYLKHPPIIPGTVELRVDLQQLGRISCVDPTATRATVSTTATTMILSITSPTRPAPSLLTLASYTTVNDLATAINALAGWQCAVNGYETWLVSDLEPNPGLMGALANSTGNSNAFLLAYLRDLSVWAMDHPEVGEIEITETRPQAFRFPDKAFGAWGSGYSSGIRGGADPRMANVRCSYSAGFDPAGVLAPETPEDLQMAVALTIKGMLDSGQFSGIIQSMSLGNTSVTVGTPTAIPDAAKGFASAYVLRRF